jgi:hypothetical protein
VDVAHVTVYRWVQRLTLEFVEAARTRRHTPAACMASNTSSSAAWSKAIVLRVLSVSSIAGLTDRCTVAAHLTVNTRRRSGRNYTTSGDATPV